MEHTKGKVEVKQDNEYPLHGIWTVADKNSIPVYIARNCFAPNSLQNAELMADAFNTKEVSGLTPSQLYKQNQELLEFLIDLRNGDYVYINNATFEKADELINNAKTK